MTWNETVYALVRRIPRGRVATYGQIALLLGRPRGGREVGWAMSACSDPGVPCHRVVDRNGRLAPRFGGIGPVVQRDRLAAEGVRFRGPDVDLARYAWAPRFVAASRRRASSSGGRTPRKVRQTRRS